jgi:sugar transferase (PEP-CTERM/EpsH1 system associated)
MKILFVLPYVPSRIRVRPFHFIHELGRRHEITVLATGSEQRDVEALAELRPLCARVEVVPFQLHAGLWSCGVAALAGHPLQSAVCQSPRLRERLAGLIGSQHFDVVHIEHLRAARLHEVLPRGTPTVFDSVDCISLLLERTLRSSHSPRQRLIAAVELARTRRFEGHILRQFDATIVTSSDDARALATLARGAPIEVIPNGVDLEHFRPDAEPPEAATLVFSGKMSYHANASAVLHFVRDILPLVRAARPDVRLRVVGSNPPPAIQALAEDSHIRVTGHVSDMRQALAGATLAICPVTVKVGIQNKVLEAMALGLPVVCSRLGAEGLEAEPGRDFLVADTDAMFAQQVCRLLDEPGLRASLAEAGRQYVETYHRWDLAAGRLEAVYDGIVRAATVFQPRGHRLVSPGQ